jgi:putative nucleotidyltransferase with HDIG domain
MTTYSHPRHVADAVTASEPRPRAERRGAGRLSEALRVAAGPPVLEHAAKRVRDAMCDPRRPDRAAALAAAGSDPGLVLMLLRAAGGNANRAPAESLADAVCMLEPSQIEGVARHAPSYRALAPARRLDRHADQLRLHSLAVQRIAEVVARATGVADARIISTGALLHDIGKLTLAVLAPGYPARVYGDAHTPGARLKAERRTLGFDHATVGGLLARQLGLAPRLSRIIERHHAGGGGEIGVVALADLLAHRSRGDAVETDRLLAAARAVDLDADDVEALMHDVNAGSRVPVEACPLTPTQLDVIQTLARGMSYKEIALELGVSASTIRSHLHHAYTTLGVSDRAQAVLTAVANRWIEVPELGPAVSASAAV